MAWVNRFDSRPWRFTSGDVAETKGTRPRNSDAPLRAFVKLWPPKDCIPPWTQFAGINVHKTQVICPCCPVRVQCICIRHVPRLARPEVRRPWSHAAHVVAPRTDAHRLHWELDILSLQCDEAADHLVVVEMYLSRSTRAQ